MNFKLKDLRYMVWSYMIIWWMEYLCTTNSCDILAMMCNILWRYQFIWCVPFDDDYICRKCFATSLATLSYFMMIIFVTNVLPCQLPPNLWWNSSSQQFCHVICHVACHVIKSMTNVFVINVLPRHIQRHHHWPRGNAWHYELWRF